MVLEVYRMGSLIFKLFSVLFKTMGILLYCGLMRSVLIDQQKKAFATQQGGLVNMLKVNQQLVGNSSFAENPKPKLDTKRTFH